MSSATALAAPRRLDLRQLLVRRPELGAAVVVALAWATLLLLAARGASGGGVSGGAVAHGNDAMPHMTGMHMHDHTGRPGLEAIAGGLPYWVLMTIAMMGPAALAGVRHTGLNSLRWRRRRAMAEFSCAYLAGWTALGGIVLVATTFMPGMQSTAALALALAAAAGWQLSPLKRRWLRDCHRSVPLPPHGWRAERGALRFGLRNGLSCLGSCWCLMLVMTVAPAGHLLWTAVLTCFITIEKMQERPRRATRLGAVGLGIAALATLVVALSQTAT